MSSRPRTRPRVHPTPPVPSHRQQVRREDARVLLIGMTIFAVLLASAASLHAVYRWTGPHPRMTVLIRKAKHHARWLIPGLKSRPHARPTED